MLEDRYRLEKTVAQEVDKMAQYEIAPGKPRPPMPFVLVTVFAAFLGFFTGMLIAMISGGASFPWGLAIGALFAFVAIILRAVSQKKGAVHATELQSQVHDLEVEASKLEAELARSSGAFDRWEKK